MNAVLVRSLLGAAGAAGIAAGAIMCSSPAKADVNTDAFLNVMHEQGFYNDKGDYAMVNVAHGVCTSLDFNGGDLEEAIYDLWMGSQMDVHESSYFVGAAVAAFCPEYAPADRTSDYVA